MGHLTPPHTIARRRTVTVSSESPRLQEAKREMSAKQLVDWDWTMSECSDTNAVF